jgi:hypothetical protein
VVSTRCPAGVPVFRQRCARIAFGSSGRGLPQADRGVGEATGLSSVASDPLILLRRLKGKGRMRRGAIVGFSFGAWTAGIVATSSERNLLENRVFGKSLVSDPQQCNLPKTLGLAGSSQDHCRGRDGHC